MFMNTSLFNCINRLILEDGYSDWDDLPESDIDALIALAWNDEIDWMVCRDITQKLITYMENGTPEYALHLAKSMRSALKAYHIEHVMAAFNDRYSWIDLERKEESGLRRYVDPINGEVTWRK